MANEFDTLLEVLAKKELEKFDYATEIEKIQKELYKLIIEKGKAYYVTANYPNYDVVNNMINILRSMGYDSDVCDGESIYISISRKSLIEKLREKIEFGDSCNDMLTSSNDSNDFEEEVNKEFLRLEEVFKHYYSIKDIDISVPYEVSFDYYDGDFVLALFDKLNKVGYGGNIVCSYNSGSNCFKYSLKINLENIYYILRKEGKVKTLSYRQLPNGEIDC